MASYQEIVSQIAALQQQAEEIKKQERKEVIKSIKAQIAAFDLTASDLGLTGKQVSRKASNVSAKYRNPETGETWSGRGLSPKWIKAAEAAGKSRDSFLI